MNVERDRVREDRRKQYPRGTRGSVEINAETDWPQTRQRGEEFARIIGEEMVAARARLEERLRAAGFPYLKVKIREADLAYWFDADIVEERCSS